MIRRSFITTLLVALGLAKVADEEVCITKRWERQPDGSYSYGAAEWDNYMAAMESNNWENRYRVYQ